MSDDFYSAFEEKYYAPREVIKGLRRQYLPFTDIISMLYRGAGTYDIGCGRGEWLELMLESRMRPFGMDLNDGMLQACRDLNLPASQGDAVAYLSTLDDESQAVISAFHVVEHISFDQLRTVVSEALRVLKQGGLLIIETPNPENIVVATRNFYLDPTHKRPIPPQLLSFLSEYYGFARTKVLRLQESKDLARNTSPTLNDVLEGVSPDYAVIGQKSAPQEILQLFDQIFGREYGLPLSILADRYHATILERVQQAEARATQAEAHATQAEAHATQAEAHATQAEACVTVLLRSTSWRMTAPLRWLGSAVPDLTPQTLKKKTRLFVQHAALYVGRRPRLKTALLGVLKRFPSLRSRLLQINTGTVWQEAGLRNVPTDIAHLTPRARQIYADLKAAIERRRKE